MCGIVGYIGNKQAQDILLSGLSKLEYRGYDSAGVAIYHAGKLQIEKAKGRLSVLAEKLTDNSFLGNIGIGHTRWATHGRPSDVNAHPHYDELEQFAVVHNGIIENYLEIKEELLAKGVNFRSETDTEVIAHLLNYLYDGDLITTVQKAIKKMRGAYALAIIYRGEPDKLIAVRQDSPLVIGIGKGENFIASDIPAILEHTRDVYLLNNGEMAVLTKDNIELTTVDGGKIERTPYHVEWDAATAEKEGFDHFMLKEIYEQPKALNDTLQSRISIDGKRVQFNELKISEAFLKEIDLIHIVACGTSYHAGLVGKALIEQLTKIPVEIDVASEYRYRHPLTTKNTLIILISQSGETADTLAALREMKGKGKIVLAITNVVGSSIAREADEVLYTWAGPEIAVASTKAYTTQLMVLYLFAIYLAQLKESTEGNYLSKMVEELQQMPELTNRVLSYANRLKELAEKIKKHDDLFFIGRSLDFAVSLEGSLKLKEISYIHSEAYPAGELKHGTLALITKNIPVIALATQTDIYEKMVSNIKEVKAREAYVIGFALEGDEELIKSVDQVFHIPQVDSLLTPILTVIPLQLLAYYAAVARGNDVDKPRNLAKSVTVE